jgi:hypothetical protein
MKKPTKKRIDEVAMKLREARQVKDPSDDPCSAHGCSATHAHRAVLGTSEVVLCDNHAAKWNRLQIDLPLAIQELHAVALLHFEVFRSDTLPLETLEWALTARARVQALRKLEAELKGGAV